MGKHLNLKKYWESLSAADGHLPYALLSTYATARTDLSRTELEAIEAHLQTCLPCQDKLREIREMESAWQEAEGASTSAEGRAFPLYRIAAVLALLVLSGGIFFYLWDGPLLEEERAKVPVSEIVAQYAENFAENPILENFIDRVTRSDTPVNLLAPANGDTLEMPAMFSWESASAAAEFELRIVDNKNQVVWQGSTTETSARVDLHSEPGLYYWMLRADGELQGVRKFYVVTVPE